MYSKLQLMISLVLALVHITPNLHLVTVETVAINSEETTNNKKCSIFKDVGVNDLSINDIVVKNSKTNIACIKARFALAIKVQTTLENSLIETDNATNKEPLRITLGYLPLDSIVHVEDSCPEEEPTNPKDGQQVAKKDPNLEGKDELEMIVTFECGKLGFTFSRQENFYLSSIKGVVNLDSNTMREFISVNPMFFTTDLNHHFEFKDLIAVESAANAKAFILTAHFYYLEFETYRKTTSRDFIRPPDDKSKPFEE